MTVDETSIAQKNGYRPSRRHRARSRHAPADTESLINDPGSDHRSRRHRSRSRTRSQAPPLITDEEYANLAHHQTYYVSRPRRSRSRRAHRAPSPPPGSVSSSESPSPTVTHADRQDLCEHCRRHASRNRASSRSSRDRSRDRKRDDKKRKSKRKAKRRSESAHRSHTVEQHAKPRLSTRVTMWELDKTGMPKKSRVKMPDSCLSGAPQRFSALERERRVHFADFADLYYF